MFFVNVLCNGQIIESLSDLSIHFHKMFFVTVHTSTFISYLLFNGPLFIQGSVHTAITTQAINSIVSHSAISCLI